MTSVLVTGGSSGIGRAAALRFAARGDRLALVSRSAAALAQAAEDCRRAGAVEVLTLTADVASQREVEAAVDAAIEAFGALDVCVHGAAVAAYGRLDDVPAEVYDRVLDVNIKGTVHVARAVLRHFRSEQAGVLILVGSVVGRISAPYLSAYGVSKWAIRSLARTLHLEARDLPGVHVCEVWPGGVNTPVYEQSATYAGRNGRPPPPVVSADRVAEVIVRTANRPKPRTGVGWANPLMMFGFAALPGAYDRLVGPLMLRLGIAGPPVASHPGNVLDPQPAAERVDGPWRGWLGLRSR
ncbi:MAG: SDR family NAD(P)-dependent oxidoreductase [Geodermatophilaceae bacterium]|nr:SDR family NAD(P)-dependent oxidoreductase [Geodermatophilaceae bacterium]MDQ3455033.1 SDR family NAD(P)-dependent oxidoreductase [Actinomycetota bacterium]